MGNCSKKIKSNMNTYIYRDQNQGTKIGVQTECPKCGFKFQHSITFQKLNDHIEACIIQQTQKEMEEQNFMWEYVRKGDCKYEWIKQPYLVKFNKIQLKQLSIQQAKKLNFQEKWSYFYLQLEKLRIPWQEGFDPIGINKQHVIDETLEFIDSCNLHKEIKIFFDDDKVSDAGGLQREWIHLIIKELCDSKLGFLQRTDTQEHFYKLNPQFQLTEKNINITRLFGQVLGKAVFEKIPVICHLNIPFIKLFLDQEIVLEDFQTFDNQLYQSWMFILNNSINDTFLELNFTIQNNKKTIELKPGGASIMIEDENKYEYVRLLLKAYSYSVSQMAINNILSEFYKVIPKELISIFEPNQFQMLINGLCFIDIEDWEINTEYKGEFHRNHYVIQMFWNHILIQEQLQLQKFLQFCTGSTRTNIRGFKYLESNRGEIQKFNIQSVPYNELDPYPKAHTCFNRLELPLYQNYDQLKQGLDTIIYNTFEGTFGLD